MLALHCPEVYRGWTGLYVAQPELLVISQTRTSPVRRTRTVALPRAKVNPGPAGSRAITPRGPRAPAPVHGVMLEAVLVRPPLFHRLAVAADAPEALPALGAVHGWALLGLADVGTLLVAAPQMSARII
jgi:hypothetical protein